MDEEINNNSKPKGSKILILFVLYILLGVAIFIIEKVYGLDCWGDITGNTVCGNPIFTVAYFIIGFIIFSIISLVILMVRKKDK